MPPESPSPTAGPRSCGERNRDSADVCGETYTCDRCRQRMEIDRLRACADALRECARVLSQHVEASREGRVIRDPRGDVGALAAARAALAAIPKEA